MNNSDRIIEALEQGEDGACDDCLSRLAGVHPRQQVHQICRRLAESGASNRKLRECSVCGRVKLVNRLAHARPPNTKDMGTPPPPVVEDRSAVAGEAPAHLDHIRRTMIEMLNNIEAPAKRKEEGFAGRVSRMRDAGLLPGSAACMMLTLNTLRNLIVYECYVPGCYECSVIESAWAAVQEWWKSRQRR